MDTKLLIGLAGSITILLCFFVWMFMPCGGIGPACTAWDPLVLTASSGTAPLNAQVRGPSVLTSLRYKTAQPDTGCGFDIDWGDGSSLSGTCSDNLFHTYYVPGVYQVEASVWRPIPGGEPITDWKGKTEVRVAQGYGVTLGHRP